MANFMCSLVVVEWENRQSSENLNTTLEFRGESFAELLLLKNLLEKLDWNSCHFVLIKDSCSILNVQMKVTEAELLKRRLEMEDSSCTTTLGPLIQAICLVRLGT